MDETKILRDTIRELARKRGYSINRLADFSGVDRGHMSRLLRGEKSPTLSTLQKIAGAVDLTLFELFAEATKRR